MQVVPFVRLVTAMLSDLEVRLRDTTNSKWSKAEIYHAINHALDTISTRVYIPSVYVVASTAGTEMYTLPWYVRNVADVLILLSGDTNWRRHPGWSIIESTGGTRTLKVEYSETGSMRVLFKSPYSALPTVDAAIVGVTTTADDFTTTATSLEIQTLISASATTRPYPEAGVIRIGTEWISYVGYDRSGLSAEITLLNCSRGQYESTALASDSGAAVTFGVPAYAPDIYTIIGYEAVSFLMGLFLSHAPSAETEHYQFQMRLYKTMATDFWKRRTPQAAPKIHIGDGRAAYLATDNWQGTYP